MRILLILGGEDTQVEERSVKINNYLFLLFSKKLKYFNNNKIVIIH